MTSLTVAVDLGGTWLRATTVEHGLLAAERVRVSPTTGPGELGGALTTLAGRLLGDRAQDVSDVVIAVPTFVGADGRLLDCPALPRLTGVHLSDLVSHEWGRELQVRVVPDIAAATLGEAAFGTGRGVQRFVCVAIGTGANASAVVEGELLTTAYGCMGDAGHVVVEVDGLPCTCGGRGCLETRASGWALDREAARAGLEGAAALVAAAGTGDRHAVGVLERAGTALGAAMATWSVLVWPDVIAVAGGVSRAGEVLLEPARAALARHAPPYIGSRIQVVAAQLGPDATLAGCLAQAREFGTNAVL